MLHNKILTKLKGLAKNSLIVEVIVAASIAIFLEVVFLFKYNLNMPFGNWILMILNLGVVLCIIALFKKNKSRYIGYLVYILFLLAIFVMDMTLYYFKTDVTSIAMLFEFGRNTMTFGLKYPPWESFEWYKWIIVIATVVCLALVLRKVTLLHEETKKGIIKKRLLGLAAVIASFVIAPFFLSKYEYLVFKNPSDKSLYVERFGLLTYHTQDLLNFINNQIDINFRTDEYLLYIEENLVEEEFVPSIYFNHLKDENIIMIMCETCEEYAFEPFLTPNYYRLMGQGIYFNNFYSAATRNYTYDAEFKSLTSMMYFNPDNYMHTYGNNIYSNALPSVLAENGYTTSAFHNFDGDFFNRTTVFPNLGFQTFYASEDMDLTKGDFWSLDSEMFEQMIDRIAPIQDSPFFSYVLTVTPHGPHNNYRTELEPYYEIILAYADEFDFPEGSPLYVLKNREEEDKFTTRELQILTLMAAQMDFDKGLGILLADLEEKDLLDSTTIILYSDHKNYSSIELTKEFTANSDIPYEIDKVQMIISSSKLTQGINDTLSSHYDLAPTIMDLLGIEFRPEFYWGQSLFLDERKDKPIILSHSNWISKDMKVISDKYTDEVETDSEEIDEDILSKKAEIDKIINLYLSFFITDYFNNTKTVDELD